MPTEGTRLPNGTGQARMEGRQEEKEGVEWKEKGDEENK